MQCNPELTKNEVIKIVIKKLKKNPLYYTSWDMSGVEGYEPEYMSKSSKPEDWQMKPVKGGDMVDKKLGMQPVKDIEKPKKDSDKGGEANKVVKGVESMSLIAKAVRGLKKMDATGEKMKKISVKENMDFLKFKTSVDQNDWSKMTPDQKKTVLSAPTMQRHIGTKTPEQLTTLANLSWEEITSDSPERQAAGIATNASVLNGFFNTPSPLKEADLTQSPGNLNNLSMSDQAKRAKEIHDKEEAKRKTANVKDEDIVKKYNEMFGKNPQTKFTDVAKALNIPEDQVSSALAVSTMPKMGGLRERLKEMIRKELKETFDGRDNMTDVAGHQVDEMNKYEPLSITKADRDRDLDAMLDDAVNDMDDLVRQVGDDTKLGITLIARARVTKPSLVPGLRQALNLYNK
jgi:hypothetical protein